MIRQGYKKWRTFNHSLVPLADKTHKDMRFTLHLLSRKVFCLKSVWFFHEHLQMF